jgi:hypothetical protein
MTQAALLSGVGSNANSGGTVNLTSGTAQASTSGTSIDFTGIPSWVKRITVNFKDVSTNGSSAFIVQIGSGSVTTSGYSSGLWSGASTNLNATNGFIASISNASYGFSGIMTINLQNTNTYVATCVSSLTNPASTANTGYQSVSVVTLSGAADRVRFTTFNGTDTFDAGSINILYE